MWKLYNAQFLNITTDFSCSLSCVCVWVCGFYYSIVFNHVTFLIFKILCAFALVEQQYKAEKNDACSFFSTAAHTRFEEDEEC